MAHYLLQTAYSPLGWSAMLKNPQNRLEAIQPVVSELGGSIVDGWMQFGEYDVLIVCELPDNVSAAALSMAISAGGAVKSVKTTPLLTLDDSVTALRQAASASYSPPASEFPYFGA